MTGREPAAVTIDVAGRPVKFDLTSGEHLWIAFAELADHCILLRGRHLDPGLVRLEPVSDLAGFLSGDQNQRPRPW